MTFMENYFQYLPVDLKIKILQSIHGWKWPCKIDDMVMVDLGNGIRPNHQLARITMRIFVHGMYEFEICVLPVIKKDQLLTPPLSSDQIENLNTLRTKCHHWRLQTTPAHTDSLKTMQDSLDNLAICKAIEESHPDTTNKEIAIDCIRRLQSIIEGS